MFRPIFEMPVGSWLMKFLRKDDRAADRAFDHERQFEYRYSVLDDIFADGPFRFQMQFGRGTFAEFYGSTGESHQILAQRAHWLTHTPERCLAVLPEASALLEEAARLGVTHGTLPSSILEVPGGAQLARAMGGCWEPDYLVLARSSGGIRLVCGCVCFPSSWALEEKIGLGMDEIHGIVPELNARIGRQIQLFLERLKPGSSWTRSNWGLSRSAELNQHPARKLPRLDGAIEAREIFLRVEEQSLVALPETNGILFGIRIKNIALEAILGTPAASKLQEALATMPEPVARYKGLAAARARILELLSDSA